jgi:hypothetical protein
MISCAGNFSVCPPTDLVRAAQLLRLDQAVEAMRGPYAISRTCASRRPTRRRPPTEEIRTLIAVAAI